MHEIIMMESKETHVPYETLCALLNRNDKNRVEIIILISTFSHDINIKKRK